MNLAKDDGIHIIRELLGAQDIKLSQTAAGLKVSTDDGFHIEIKRPENPAAPVMSVRLLLKELDLRQRIAQAGAARHFLEKTLAGLITGVNDFRNTAESEAGFVYDSRMEVDPEVVFFETIRIGSKAGDEISAKPVSGMPPAAESVPDIAVLTGRAADIQAAEAAIAEMETIDSKMLRQSLDMMNLRRSSIVRLALTRIFRDAVDVSRLQSAIREEAEKIVSKEDRAELDLIRHVSTDFLKPVIELLHKTVIDRD